MKNVTTGMRPTMMSPLSTAIIPKHYSQKNIFMSFLICSIFKELPCQLWIRIDTILTFVFLFLYLLSRKGRHLSGIWAVFLLSPFLVGEVLKTFLPAQMCPRHHLFILASIFEMKCKRMFGWLNCEGPTIGQNIFSTSSCDPYLKREGIM